MLKASIRRQTKSGFLFGALWLDRLHKLVHFIGALPKFADGSDFGPESTAEKEYLSGE